MLQSLNRNILFISHFSDVSQSGVEAELATAQTKVREQEAAISKLNGDLQRMRKEAIEAQTALAGLQKQVCPAVIEKCTCT